MSLLVAGFGRFENGPNCSEALLKALAADGAAARAWGGPVAFALFDVDVETIGGALARAVAESRPTHVLLTGQAASRAALTLETTARNRLDLRTPDAAGRLGALGPAQAGGPAERAASWPDLRGCAAAMRAAGVAAELSDDAGAHLCNQSLYLALELAERARPAFVAAFLHLPLLPEQVAARIPAALRAPDAELPSLAAVKRATLALLRHTSGAPEGHTA